MFVPKEGRLVFAVFPKRIANLDFFSPSDHSPGCLCGYRQRLVPRTDKDNQGDWHNYCGGRRSERSGCCFRINKLILILLFDEDRFVLEAVCERIY